MSVELIKQPLVLNTGRKNESAQVIKERDTIVPDGKPDIKKVVQMDGKVDIEQIEVQQDRIVYKGKIDLTILYVPENDPTGICIMKTSIPLEDFLVVEGIDKDNDVKLTYSIEHLHWNVLNERKLNVKVILQLGIDASSNEKIEFLVDCSSEEPIQIRNKDINFSQKGDIKEEKIIIKEELTIPSGKGNIQEILKSDITISDKEIRRTDEEIFYSGNLNITILYKVQDDETKVELVSYQVPFSNAIEYIKRDGENYYDCELDISQQYTSVSADMDGEDRIIEVEAVVKARASNVCDINAKAIDDIYCIDKNIELEGADKKYIHLLHKEKVCTNKKETITLDASAPDIESIYSINMKANIESTKIDTDKISIEGLIDTKIIYTSQDEYQRLACMNTMLPFKQEIFIEGIGKDSNHSVDTKIEDIKITSQGKKEVTVEFKVCSSVEVYTSKSIYLVEDIILTDMDMDEIKKLPSMIIYTVKKGDSYWSIAKKYNTTVEELAKINDVDINETLYPGKKLMILKKTNY